MVASLMILKMSRYVNILKQELRENNALKINYATKKDKKSDK